MNIIIDQLLPIFKIVFDNEDLVIDSSTAPQDIDGWDSLAHIRLIIAIEKSFGLRFSAAEIAELENVGLIVELIVKKS